MSTVDAIIRERIADTGRSIKRAEQLRKRAACVAEIRGHIRVTLMSLVRYEPHYADMLNNLEDEWSAF